MEKLRTVGAGAPCIGSIGTVHGGPLSKRFQKVGEPEIKGRIQLSLGSEAFGQSGYNAYKGNREAQGAVPTIPPEALGRREKPRYHRLELTDLVNTKELLNDPVNAPLLAYLGDDRSLEMVTSISFVAPTTLQSLFDRIDHASLSQRDGRLALVLQDGDRERWITMADLEVFDFGTSGFCWREDNRHRARIAALARDGRGCPRGTERAAAKLDNERNHLKL